MKYVLRQISNINYLSKKKSNINYVYSLAKIAIYLSNYYKKESDAVRLYLLKSFKYYYYLVSLNYV